MNQRQSPEVEELILKNRRLVYHIAKKYLATYNDMEELASIGTIGLIKAAQTFNESNGAKFATYASRCISNQILMFLRKEKPHANDISLDDILSKDSEGNDLTLLNVLPSSNTDFTEVIVERDVFERFINIILNLLNQKERLIMLYKIADINQNYIAERISISQSYVSRIEKKVIQKVKSYLINTEPFKEVFSMAIQNDLYRISFSSKDVKNFCKIFSTLLQKLQPDSNLPDFKVNCNNERIIILLPADPQSFAFVAEIMQEIDNFSMTYVSNKSIAFLPDKEIEIKNDLKKISSAQSINETSSSIEDDDSNMDVNEVSSNESIQETNSLIENGDSNMDVDEIPYDESIKETNSPIEDDDSNMVVDSNESVVDVNFKNIIKNESIPQKKVTSTQVRNYFMKQDSFTVQQLKEKFPNSNSAITNAIFLAKQNGLIKPHSRGKYSVICKK